MMDAGQAYQAGLHYPPILSAIAIRRYNLKEEAGQIDALFEEAIKGYEDPFSIPAKLWVYAGENKSRLGDHKKGKEYLEKALEQKNSLNDTDQAHLWAALMHMSKELKKWKEAEEYGRELFFYNSFLDGGSKLNYGQVYSTMALIKAQLGKWEEANFCLTKAISLVTSNPNNRSHGSLWKQVVDIKMLDERWEEAEEFMQKYMDCENSPPPYMLLHMTRIKFRLGKLLEAKTYIDKARAVFQPSVPPQVERMTEDIIRAMAKDASSSSSS